MARKIRDEKLQTRESRRRLAPRREPYWRAIQEGRAIGYRKPAGGKAGTWIARYYDPNAEPPMVYRALGPADDLRDQASDGDAMTFATAQDLAGEWFTAVALAGGKVVVPLTVAKAVEHYLADYTARGGKALAATQRAINAHILPAFGSMNVADLTTAKLKAWHHALSTAPARVRKKAKATKLATRKVSADPDDQRARRATANRVLTILKATLNLAYREDKVASDAAWRKVKPFKSADGAKVRYLTDEESTRLVNACPADFRELVTAALLTGCRYGELVALETGDIDITAHVLTVRDPKGKSGKARHVTLTDEACEFFTQRCHGKKTRDRVLVREDGEAWGPSWQFRPMREACKAASIKPAISFHILRHTHASRLARAGVPLLVIAAQLGHRDVRMTTQHYAHLAPSHVSDVIRAGFSTLGIVPKSNITRIEVAG